LHEFAQSGNQDFNIFIMAGHTAFQLSKLSGKLLVNREHFTHPDESSNDENAGFDCSVGIKNAGQHYSSMFRKYIG
jgi:hypothetical protein